MYELNINFTLLINLDWIGLGGISRDLPIGRRALAVP